jgi:hypothetical protein
MLKRERFSTKCRFLLVLMVFIYLVPLKAQTWYTQSGGTVTKTSETFTSTVADQSGVKVTNSGTLTMTNCTVITSGNTSSNDNSSFYGQNAGVLATTGSKITMTGGSISTSGTGANGIFSYGTGTNVIISNATVQCTAQGGHAVMATGGGTLTATNVNMNTAGMNSGAIATDRGGGTIIVTGGTVVTSGKDSPGIYSTGNITVSGANITATASEGAVIEGLNTVTLNNVTLQGGVATYGGVMIMQSMSGDASVGTGNFIMTGGSLTATTGPLFFITNNTGVIRLTNVTASATSGVLISAAGTSRWGTSGSNGGQVTFVGDTQTLSGNIEIDAISTLTATLQNNSSLTGTINSANTAKLLALTIDATSKWTLTGNSYISTLSNSSGISGTSVSNIIGNGYNVYYDASLSGNSALGGKTYSLVNGGYLLPKGSTSPFSISGTITYNGNPLSGVTVTLSGSSSATTTTNTSGYYSFSFTGTGSYTVTPSLTNYTFTPVSKSFTNISSNQTQNFTAGANTYTISGNISGASSVTVNLTGSSTASTTNDATGNYSFTVNAGGTYTITPNKTNYTFNPINKTFSNIAGNQTQNFTAVLNTFTISGIVSGAANVNINLTGSSTASTATDANGNYSFTVNAGGTYTITPVKTGYTFSPASQTFTNITANQVQNFTASSISYTLTGVILCNNSILGGVTITLSGSSSGTTISDSNGEYSFTEASGGTYTITPNKTNYTFNPANKTFSNIAGNQTQNFTAVLNTCTISGNISGVGSVTVNLSGSSSASMITDANGNYSFTVIAGGTYAITPQKAYYSFTPANKTFTNISGNQVQNFSASLNLPDIVNLFKPVNKSSEQEINLTLIWYSTINTVSYDLQVSKDSLFSTGNIIINTNLSDTSYKLSNLENNITYFWKLRSKNSAGVSNWSSIWYFTTKQAPLGIPVLVSPLNNTKNILSEVSLAWNQVTGASDYLYQISDDSTFAQIKIQRHSNGSITAKESGLNSKTNYFWKVRAESGSNTGNWSQIWKFTTAPTAPAAPLLKSPLNNASLQINYLSPSVTLEWNSSTDASDYIIQISENQNFNPIYKEDSGYQSTTYKFTLPKASKYYWRIKAHNLGGSGTWSEIWNFSSALVGIEKPVDNIPVSYSLSQNFPNPFNPETNIEYSIPEKAFVIIRIYDTFGKTVETLIGKYQVAGMYRVSWHPDNLPSGTYYYRIQAGNYSEVKKMVYIR